MSELQGITNFVQLRDDLGTSGQPQVGQFAAIASAGYAAVINLALPTSDHAIPEEGSVVTGLGMRYFHIPVDFAAPTVDDLRTFFGVMRALEGRKVWVHCVVNARVSAFCYHYLRHVRGLDEAASRSPVLASWEPRMDEVWRRFLALTPDEIGLDAAAS
jgi:protein tyrosine phosphatase (PTP) superfamily phosphohydrolase (DUF442 family)